MASPPPSSATSNQDDGNRRNKSEVDVLQDEIKAERAATLKKYKADYARWMMAKYFSHRGLDGEDIFDKETALGEEIVKSGSKSFTDLIRTSKDEITTSSSAAQTSSALSKKATAKEETGGSNERGN